MQLHQSLRADKLATEVIVFSFADAQLLLRWRTQVLETEADPMLFANTRFVADANLRVYHAYGLGRNALWQVYHPRVLLHYAGLALRGKRLPATPQDPLQRGADFVVARDGRIALGHVGRNQADRPTPAALLAALR